MDAGIGMNGDGARPRRADRDRLQGAAASAGLEKLFDRLPPHSLEAERSLLGSLLLDPAVLGEVVTLVSKPEQFYSTAHGSIFRAILEVYDAHRAGDPLLIAESLRDRGLLESAGGPEVLVELAESVPSARHAAHYARIIATKAKLRRLIDASAGIIHRAFHAGEGGPEDGLLIVDEAEAAIFEIAQETDSTGPEKLSKLLADELIRIEQQAEGGGTSGVPTGFFDLDDLTSGLQPGEMFILAARPSMGKAQPLDAQVLTPTGFVRMGDLRVGDDLASVDGEPSVVAGIYPQGERQVYRVRFADGRSTECCDEHLWSVRYRDWDGPRVLPTSKLREMLTKARYRNRLFVEPFAGEFGEHAELPVDPWLLGALIGDGNMKGTAIRFSSADPAIIERVTVLAEELGLAVTKLRGYDLRLVRKPAIEGAAGGVRLRVNPLKAALEGLGLWDRGADTKFIPERYMAAPARDRRALLAGLIDTDGWVESWGSVRFATASRTLADQVVSLTRSLGGSGSWTRKRTSYTYEGVRREGLPAYVCNLQLPDASTLGLLSAKGERAAGGRERQRRLNIVAIEPTRVCETRCIAVSHPSRLYVTDDYIVTHNTAFSLNLAEQVAFGGRTPWSPRGEGGEPMPVGFFSLEMSKEALAQRLLSARSGIDAHKLRTGDIGHDDWQKLSDAAAELYEAPIYIDDTPGLTILQLRAKARRMVDQHGLKVLFIDYLQLLTAPGAARESRQVEVSTISRQIKALARELKVPVVCLAQLNRGAEQRENNRPRMSDLRESGSIEQDADVVGLLHREAYYHRGDPAWDPKSPEFDPENEEKLNLAELIIAKQRNGPTGTVHLTWDDSTTRFKNHDWRRDGAGSGGGGYGHSGGGSASWAPPAPARTGPAEEPAPFDADDGPPQVEIRRSAFAPRPATGPVADHRDGGGPDDAFGAGPGLVDDGYDDDEVAPF